MTRTRRWGVTLLELLIATAALLAVLGPLLYLLHVGRQTTSGRYSAAMLACLVAAERLRADLDRMGFPDGPDAGAAPPFEVREPGPDEGSCLRLWIPRTRTGAVPKQLELVPVEYRLEPVSGTAVFTLTRKEAGEKAPVSGVYLRTLTFSHLRSSGPSGPTTLATGTTLDLADDSALPSDMLRVSLVGVAEPATAEALARTDARRVQDFATSFLHPVREPTLFPFARDPAAGERYQVLKPVGSLAQ